MPSYGQCQPALAPDHCLLVYKVQAYHWHKPHNATIFPAVDDGLTWHIFCASCSNPHNCIKDTEFSDLSLLKFCQLMLEKLPSIVSLKQLENAYIKRLEACCYVGRECHESHDAQFLNQMYPKVAWSVVDEQQIFFLPWEFMMMSNFSNHY